MKNVLNPLSIKKYFKDQVPPDINKLRQTRKKFTDPYFPPRNYSFISCDKNGHFIDQLKGKESLDYLEKKLPGLINRIVWKRATEIYKKWDLVENKIEIRDIVQGHLGDCYFLSALTALTRYQYLLIEKFRTKKFNEEGYYEMIFFIDGEWQIVFVDDYFPFDPIQKQFVGARPHHNELWAILLEKAWIKINGGYTNSSGGLFSEAILSLTGFPTEIFRHKNIENEKDIINLYRNIEIGYKEGSIMACGSKSNEPNVENFGLCSGHCYSIVYPHKWKEKNIYLIKIRNPWGKDKWRGNWSDYSKCWTEENVKYFKYQKTNDGTLWIELKDFIYFFDNTFICHLLYGALVKYFYFEYPTYFKRPSIFNLLVKQKANTSISVLFKNWRFNREIHDVKHPFILLLSKYNKYRKIEKIWTKWDCEDGLNIVETLDAGYYSIWLYCPLNLISGDSNFKYILQISSLSQYEIEFLGLDHDFSFIQYLVTDNYKNLNSQKFNSSQNFLIFNNEELFSNGLFNSLIFNISGSPLEINVKDNGIKNCQILPPYQGMSSFNIMIPPYETAAILGIRMSNSSGGFNFAIQARTQIGGNAFLNQPNNINMGDRFSNYLKFNISSNSASNRNLRTEEYKFIKRDMAKKLPVFNSTVFSGKETLKQSMMNKNEISPESLVKQYPNEFTILFDNYTYDNTPNKKKWTVVKNKEGMYIGQINILNGELEGRAVFFWNLGIKYIGYFLNNELNGKGLLVDKNNKLIYKGEFYKNKKHGFGLLKYNNGDQYEGNFENDKIEGNGEFHFSNGDTWEGVFQNGMKNGIGIMIKGEKELFLTQFENDNFIGEVELNNEEKNIIENLRQKDRKIFLEQKKLNEKGKNKVIQYKKNSSNVAFDLYKKKRDLTKSIRVF